MNPKFKYNGNPKYLTKDLKDVYLYEKKPSVKIQLLNIFKHHHIVAKSSPIVVGYDEWPLSNALWMKFYNSHGKYKPKSNECFHVSIPANFCNVLCYKCASYLLATP